MTCCQAIKIVSNTVRSMKYFVEMYAPDVFLYRTTINVEVTTVCSDFMNCHAIVVISFVCSIPIINIAGIS